MQIKTKIVSSHTADSKPVKQEVNGTVILPILEFPDWTNGGEVKLEEKKTFSTSAKISSSLILQESQELY